MLTGLSVSGMASSESRARVDTLVYIRHLLEVLLGLLQLAAAFRIRRFPELLNNTLERGVVVIPLNAILVHPVHCARVRHWHGLGRLAATGG